MKTLKKIIGYFLLGAPFIALGIWGMTQDKTRDFGIALLITIVIFIVIAAGAFLVTED